MIIIAAAFVSFVPFVVNKRWAYCWGKQNRIFAHARNQRLHAVEFIGLVVLSVLSSGTELESQPFWLTTSTASIQLDNPYSLPRNSSGETNQRQKRSLSMLTVCIAAGVLGDAVLCRRCLSLASLQSPRRLFWHGFHQWLPFCDR